MPEFEVSIDVKATPEMCYRLWRDFEALVAITPNLQEVKHIGGNIWRWVTLEDGGEAAVWLTELTQDIPGEAMSLRTIHGPELAVSTWEKDSATSHTGMDTKIKTFQVPELTITSSVFFKSVSTEITQVTVSMDIKGPGCPLDNLLIRLFGISERQAAENLKHFKSQAEAMSKV